MSDKKAPSFELVTCKQCNNQMQRRNLKNHYSVYHSDSDYKECLVKKGNLHGFLKRLGSESGCPSEPKKNSSNASISETNSPELPQSTHLVENNENTLTSSSCSIDIPLPEKSDIPPPDIPDQSDDIKSLRKDLNEMKEKQDKILALFEKEKAQPAKRPSAQSHSKQKDQNLVLKSYLLHSHSNEELIANVDWLVMTDDNPDLARCLICTKEEEVRQGMHGVFNLNKEFRKVKFAIKTHDKLKSHLQKLAESELAKSESLKLAKRSEMVGMRLGHIAYEIIFHGDAFISYPRRVANLIQNGLDLGNTNHSIRFCLDFVEPCKTVIERKLQEQINAPLPCTGVPSPIVLIDDKLHWKHKERHGIMIRIPVFQNGLLFKTFLLGQPLQPVGTRDEMTRTLFDTAEKGTNQTIVQIRNRLVGHTADGGIIKNLHIYVSHGQRLQVDQEYAKSILFRDAGHLLESVLEDTKKVTKWLKQFDSNINSAMVHFRVGSVQNELQQECEKQNCQYFALHLFCATRFHEYAYRTYKNFRLMWLPMFNILENISASDTAEAIEAQKGIKLNIQDPKFVLQLLFLEEVSSQFSILSHKFQEADKLPFNVKQSAEIVFKDMTSVLDKLKRNELPAEKGDHWKLFNATVNQIKKECTFNGKPLINKGSVASTRLSVKYDLTPTEIVHLAFKDFVLYLEKLLQMNNSEKFWGRFTWPDWLILSEECFDFTKETPNSIRKAKFSDLLQIQFSPHTLLENEKQRLNDEYATLCLIASTMMAKDEFKTPEEFWYKLCTKEEHYYNIKFLLGFALKPLSRTYNETILESFFSQVKDIDNEGRPLKHETVENLCYIRANGPNPLAAKSLVRAALNEKFQGKAWHFVTESSKMYSSVCVENQRKKAKEEFNLFNN